MWVVFDQKLSRLHLFSLSIDNCDQKHSHLLKSKESHVVNGFNKMKNIYLAQLTLSQFVQLLVE